ncbi:MAG: PQQ-dependent sugar dehydrogenase [Methylotetracoccus sp.]
MKPLRSLFTTLSLAAGLVTAAASNAAETVCTARDPLIRNPIPAAIIKDPQPLAALAEVASDFVSPTWAVSAPGDRRHLFVTDIVGQLWSIDLRTGTRDVVLDVADRLVKLGICCGGYDERGFLGMAFHPDYQKNGLLYTFTSEPYDSESRPSDFTLRWFPSRLKIDTRSTISEWRVDDPRAATPRVDPSSRRVVLTIDKPDFNHNGGGLAFGPDGLLYITVGDGGRGDDEYAGHNPITGNGQDRSVILGKMLRIDPRGKDSANGQYGIPQSNPYAPFAGVRGGDAGCADGFCDEIWAYGLRNPYRFSFDDATGTLFAGDVGQNSIEEVDIIRRAGNYGWRNKEGTFFFQHNGNKFGFISRKNCQGVPTAGLIDPIAQYDHDEGISVIGGFVYHGRAIPALQGRYVFGEYSKTFAKPDGRVFHIDGAPSSSAGAKLRPITELALEGTDSLGLAVFGMGQDLDGELYVLGNRTGVPSLTKKGRTGVVAKIVPIGTSQN